jgi:small subunit ribosomal protein S2
MKSLPEAVFVIDTRNEAIAVQEARKLKIPVIGIVDTNCDPDEVEFVVPGNDDALRAIRLFAGKIADAVITGRNLYESQGLDAKAAAERGVPHRHAASHAPVAAPAATAPVAPAAPAVPAAPETPVVSPA